MTDRKALLESYRKAPNLLKESMAGIPEEAWFFKPAPDKWSIHEIIVHIADSEVNGYVRLRKIIAEPGSTVMPYNQDLWTKALKYEEEDLIEFLNLFAEIRAINSRLIARLEDEVWSQHVIHPENGLITLEEWLKNYDNHIYQHINQIKRNLDACKHTGGRN